MEDNARFICSKMFTNLNIKIPYQSIKNCCKACDTHISYEEINNQKAIPDPFIQNPDYLSRKSEMLFMNRLPKNGCKTCARTEPNSLFRSWNGWKNRTYTQQDLHDLYDNDHLTYYEIMLSSSCDLKCVYCGPDDSSSWALELNEPKTKAPAKWEEKVKHRLEEHLHNKKWDPDTTYQFTFSGGEPTYNMETIDFIEKIVKITTGNKVIIGINTNLNSKPKIFEKFMNIVDRYSETKFYLYCSLEDIGERCEAVRTGINWHRAIQNFEIALQKDNLLVQMLPTPNMYSLPSMLDYVTYFSSKLKEYNKFIPEGEQIDGRLYTLFSYNMVQEAPLSPASMPAHYKSMLDPAIEYCNNNQMTYFARHLMQIQNLIGTKIDNSTATKIENKFNYFKIVRPGYDWDRLFPHVNDIIKELK